NVILCEGEPDCIKLISEGYERPFAGKASMAVTAIPSASTFKPEWAPLFSGKRVLLWLDNDPAGEKATERVGNLIAGHAMAVRIFDWKGAMSA
ncbi:MAG: toprim domain-containing protein, partial [Verrucomicrobiota bacterium]